MRKIAVKTFSPDLLKTNIENVLDGTYSWLGGTTATPTFRLDIASAKNEFASNLSNYAADRAQELPPCSLQYLKKNHDINLLTATCLPPGIEISSLKQKTLDSVANNKDFLKDPVIDGSSLKDDKGKPVFQQLGDLPKAYQTAHKAPYILGSLVLLFTLGLVFYSSTRLKGLKTISKLYLAAGVLVLIIPMGFAYIGHTLTDKASSDAATSAIVAPLINAFNKASSHVYYAVGAIYMIIGGMLFLTVKKTDLKKPEAKAK